MEYEEAIKHVVETIRDRYKPEKIILFGSRVWGKPDDDRQRPGCTDNQGQQEARGRADSGGLAASTKFPATTVFVAAGHPCEDAGGNPGATGHR